METTNILVNTENEEILESVKNNGRKIDKPTSDNNTIDLNIQVKPSHNIASEPDNTNEMSDDTKNMIKTNILNTNESVEPFPGHKFARRQNNSIESSDSDDDYKYGQVHKKKPYEDPSLPYGGLYKTAQEVYDNIDCEDCYQDETDESENEYQNYDQSQYQDEPKYEKNEQKYNIDEQKYYKDEQKYDKDEQKYYKDEQKYYKDEQKYYEDEQKYYKDEQKYDKDEQGQPCHEGASPHHYEIYKKINCNLL